MDFVLDKETFIYVLTCFPHLSFGSLEVWCLSFCKIVLYLMTLLVALIIFFEICEHIVCGHIPPLISCLLVASQLLVLEKQVGGVQSHRDWRGDLLVSRLHIGHLVQGYICKTLWSTSIWGGNIRQVQDNGSWG